MLALVHTHTHTHTTDHTHTHTPSQPPPPPPPPPLAHQAGSMTLPVGRKSVLDAVHASEQTPGVDLELAILAVSLATDLAGVPNAPVAGFLHVCVPMPT